MATRTEFNFRATNPSASRAAHRYAAKRITEIGTETRAAIRALVIRGLRENIPPRKLARMLAGRTKGVPRLIGMHSRQAMAALNYQKQLEGMGLASSTVNRLMGRYVRRKVDERALNIARTETMTALNFGRQAAHTTAMRKGLIPKGAGKEWLITPDERLCKLCEPMSGVVVGVRQKFQTARGPVMAPPLHPSCRCTTGLKPIRGGKRIGLEPRPTLPPIFPPPKPKAPPLPTSAPAPVPAPITPPAPVATVPAGGTDARPTIGVRTIHKSLQTAPGTKRAETVFAAADEILADHGERFVRVRNVDLAALELYGRNIPRQKSGVLGLHTWTIRETSIMRIKANIEQLGKADGVSSMLGTGRNYIANNSIHGTIRHEYGHAVWYQSLNTAEVNRWRSAVATLKKLPKPANALQGVGSKSALSEISVYADWSDSEAWAEAYTVFTDPQYKPGMLPAALEEILDDVLNSAPSPHSVAGGGKGWFQKWY